jgi:flagellar M-ring protein FliF
MDQIKKIFAALSLIQKIGLGAVIVLIAIGLPMFTRWQHESNLRPLFTSMAPEDASSIIAKLKENGVEYKLAENGSTVLVPADKVDEERLELAGAGLPKTGRIGFELFDRTNISLTDFGEHVNYRRAVEGELEKTIKSINGIDQARVHVTFPKDSVFLDSREPAKASVLVHLRRGMRLEPQNVVAISNLVASAVEGLSADAVSVVDMQGNLLSRQRRASLDGSDAAESTLDYKHQIEKDLTSKVEGTLEPLLGDGRFRVGVTVDCDFSTSDQTDEVYDPTRSVMSNSQKSEDLSQGAGAGGVPGTPSNLPRSQIRAQVAGGSGTGGSSVSRRTENATFETSRTVREVKVPRGVVKKISAALLVDQDVEWQGKGNQRKRVLIPPTPEKLKAIHDIVAGVLGITTDRGDQLVVETLPFEQTRNAEDMANENTRPVTPGSLTLKELMADKKILIGAGAGLLFVVLLIGFLLRRPKAAAVGAQLTEKTVIMPGSSTHQVATAGASARGESGSRQVEGATEAKDPNQGSLKELEEVLPFLQLPTMTNHAKALLDHLRKTVVKDPDAAAALIRTWMEEV